MGAIATMKVGEQISLRLFLKSCEVRKTNAKPPRDFFSGVYTDGIDDIDVKIWNYVNAGDLPETKKCYIITGTVGEYQGKKQLTLTKQVLADDQNTEAFTLSVGYSVTDLWNAAMSAIELISDDILRDIVSVVYSTYKDKLAVASSAVSVHHVGAGGNVLHSVEVFNLTSAICDTFKAYNINKSLAQSGALLHDIGKAYIYEIDGPSVDYTLDGILHEHISTGIKMLHDIKWPEEYKHHIWLLEHIIESHHGALEFGSPVQPRFLEAYAVSRADGISATFDTINTANNKAAADKNVTERIYACGNAAHLKQNYIHSLIAALPKR